MLRWPAPTRVQAQRSQRQVRMFSSRCLMDSRIAVSAQAVSRLRALGTGNHVQSIYNGCRNRRCAQFRGLSSGETSRTPLLCRNTMPCFSSAEHITLRFRACMQDLPFALSPLAIADWEIPLRSAKWHAAPFRSGIGLLGHRGQSFVTYCRRRGSFAGPTPDFVERASIKRHARHGPDVTQQQAHSRALIQINNPP